MPSFAAAKDRRTIARPLARVLSSGDGLRLALQGSDSTLPSFLEEGLPRRPQSPGAGTLDVRRFSPGDPLSRKSPATPNPHGNGFGTSRAFDCKHIAAAGELTQRQSGSRLCKNCGAVKLPVEGKGKVEAWLTDHIWSLEELM